MTIHRRDLIKGCVLSGMVGHASGSTAQDISASRETSGGTTSRPWKTIDTNLSLFRWPYRRLPDDTPHQLAAKLRSLSIAEGWAGSFEGLLHRDITGVNARLAEACQDAQGVRLVPFGSVNPTLPDWERDLQRCHEEHDMPGIRLHPNYHGYPLDDPRFERLLRSAAERDLLVQLAVAMEDPRTQHAKLQVPEVDLTPLPEVVRQVPGARLMLLNYRPKARELALLAAVPEIRFDIARVESTDGIARLVEAVSPQRVMFGTHAPFLIVESALIRIYESTLQEANIPMLLAENAKQLLGIRGPK